MRKQKLVVSLIIGSVLCISSSYADTFGGIEFPNGAVSFADEVILYDPNYSGGPNPTEPTSIDPQDALGVPDFPDGGSVGDEGAVSLGRGGLIELRFTNNFLVNSGNSTDDLHIFEIGPDVEDTYVSIRPTAETVLLLGASYDANGDGYYEIGKVSGSISSIDIDSFFSGYEAGELVFDAVQLIDDYDEGNTSGPTVGADIDAVGAIGSIRLCNYYLIGDLDYDCDVDLNDFALMASNWLVDCDIEPENPSCIPIQ